MHRTKLQISMHFGGSVSYVYHVVRHVVSSSLQCPLTVFNCMCDVKFPILNSPAGNIECFTRQALRLSLLNAHLPTEIIKPPRC